MLEDRKRRSAGSLSAIKDYISNSVKRQILCTKFLHIYLSTQSVDRYHSFFQFGSTDES